MQQDTIAMPHTACREATCRRLDAGVEFGPGPGGVAPDQRRTVGEAARRLDQQVRKV
jgi:hypothetical protein